ncbi:hypothetical protein LMH87_002680 [Akanthomyces muscarius]|uniref:Uncharacterized protein n=1 Tax=Akanthomyces muscarius TaxID=2231603 RepID=A0A9W8Q6S4_AKAMU|nr:hypothetical protein LMH87_002680 [Akanthomyces muscarius]KAJ4148200.1 hypothetical protein LMH87_002680 [Akanthomyces muscarius]
MWRELPMQRKVTSCRRFSVDREVTSGEFRLAGCFRPAGTTRRSHKNGLLDHGRNGPPLLAYPGLVANFCS